MKNLGLMETVNLAKNAVPNSRKVNGKVLSGDINITSQDIFDGQAVTIPEKINLNDYKTPGVYVQYANASAESGTNYPEPLAGSLIVLKAAGIIQRYFVYNSSRIYTRSLNDIGVWTSWAREYNTLNKPTAVDIGVYTQTESDSRYITGIRKINGKALSRDIDITSQDIFNGQAIYLGDKANLDNYKIPGVYYQDYNVHAQNGANYPEQLAGSLIVLKAAGIIQRYFVYNSSRIYTRSQYNDLPWTPWTREYNTSNPPSVGNLGVYTKEECNSLYISNIRLGVEVQIGAGGVLEYHGPNVLTGFYNRDRDYSAETLYWSPIQFLKNGQWITIVRG
ncbi:pyocin knob domain-containing protein [Photorhabdus heterorhabditis]|uniref:pyocin knob domain-containing protein n=2 Tax=Photorhabdus heterorhabditis TaxID=880156 RepID=UPI001BD2AE8F|nr:pyocin knob domain-containing protein [Photorhabdus heterorhabditis]